MSDVSRITVIGAGTMDRGIALVAGAAGYDVSLHDVSEELVREAIGSIRTTLENGISRGKGSPQARDAVLSRIHQAPRLEDAAASSELVIEAVPESLDLKREVFRRAGASAPASVVLAARRVQLAVAGEDADRHPGPGRAPGPLHPPCRGRLRRAPSPGHGTRPSLRPGEEGPQGPAALVDRGGDGC